MLGTGHVEVLLFTNFLSHCLLQVWKGTSDNLRVYVCMLVCEGCVFVCVYVIMHVCMRSVFCVKVALCGRQSSSLCGSTVKLREPGLAANPFIH